MMTPNLNLDSDRSDPYKVSPGPLSRNCETQLDYARPAEIDESIEQIRQGSKTLSSASKSQEKRSKKSLDSRATKSSRRKNPHHRRYNTMIDEPESQTSYSKQHERVRTPFEVAKARLD